MSGGPSSKKQAHRQPDDPSNIGDAWIWRAIALPSHLRVVHHLSHERSEQEATRFLAAFKARTDGQPPLFTRDKLPASIDALVANYSAPEPPPRRRRRGRPPKQSRRRIGRIKALFAPPPRQRPPQPLRRRPPLAHPSSRGRPARRRTGEGRATGVPWGDGLGVDAPLDQSIL